MTRLKVVVYLYLIIALFVAVFGLLRLWKNELITALSETEQLIASAVFVAPLLIGLVWDRLKGLKIGELELAFRDSTPSIDVELASAVQDLRGLSYTPHLIEAINAAMDREDIKLSEVNLHSTPYWWSTRLFLLAALAEEYTTIARLVFVEGDDARRYVGMASPRVVRQSLELRFPYMGVAFRTLVGNCRPANPGKKAEVQCVGEQWQHFQFQPDPNDTKTYEEKDIKQLVDATQLTALLQGVLETSSRRWRGGLASRRLYARIMTCDLAFVPLLSGRRLEKIVDRCALSIRIASSALTD
jgi:hypothetical protein